MKKYVIGMDIGGTNTDAVLVDEKNRIICIVKTVTTEDISVGFFNALKQILEQSAIEPKELEGIFLGTTHATNAILQKKELFGVGVIRIAGQRPETLPAAFAWPQELKDTVIKAVETINGGLECHGGALTDFCNEEACSSIRKLLEKDAKSIAVIGVFSPLDGYQEQIVSDLIKEIAGLDFPISLSHEIGGIGFIERENSTILNAALKQVMQKGFKSLQAVCENLKLTCPLMITQNDGSLIEVQRAIDYPVLTISAGPTNSFIGGVRLAAIDSAIVVDIGGTSTDVGLVRKGFPIRSLNKSNIGGVSLNFSMPDVLSIALGGGSTISFDAEQPLIGPNSVAKLLTSKALCFGGSELTLTDVALQMGNLEIKDSTPERIGLDSDRANAVFKKIQSQLDALIATMQGEDKDLPVVFVGGGSALLPSSYFQENYLIPAFFNVANAYGAALSEISGVVDTVVSLQNRELVLNQLGEKAKQKAISQGANPKTLRLIDQQIIPYSYVPNQMARVMIRYSGKRN